MSRLVLLDAGPLSLATNPKALDESRRCKIWFAGLLGVGIQVLVPEAADYEVRRELFRAGRRGGLDRLENLARQTRFLPVTTAVWRRAAELWARARTEGCATASDSALDCDVILAAQVQLAAEDGCRVIVATTNVGHLSHFVDAREWEDRRRRMGRRNGGVNRHVLLRSSPPARARSAIGHHGPATSKTYSGMRPCGVSR